MSQANTPSKEGTSLGTNSVGTTPDPAVGTLDGLPKKVKWSRKSVPKTRTGCRTCKTRHLKCDEEKPVCRRCIASGLRCLGYAGTSDQPPANAPSRAASMVARRARVKSRQPNNMGKLNSDLGQMMLCFLPINLDIPGPPLEKELFDHARRFTVPDLALSSGPSLFWYQHALPLSHTVKPVKHALCAFAAAHRTFLSRDRRNPFGPQNDLAIEHYNRAISQIQPLMSNPTPENIDAVLVCCVIFTTLENMVGRHTESLRHLHAGWRLLESYQPQPAAPASDCGSTTTNPQLFDDVAGMLSRLHLDTTIYVTDELVPTHGSFLRPKLDFGDCKTPFASAAEAEEAMHSFDVVFTSFIESTFSDCDFSQCSDPGTPLKDPTTPFDPDMTWEKLDSALDLYQTRFNLYFSNLRQSGTASSIEMRKATVLSLHSRVWTALMRLKCSTEDLNVDECTEILAIAESLAPILRGTETNPTFSYGVEILPAVTLVGLSCGDNVDMQRRSVALLRSLHRRESVWDSHDCAEIVEGLHIAKAKGLIDAKDVPWGMSEMAGMLAQLGVPTVGNTNGALAMLLAKNKQTRGGGC